MEESVSENKSRIIEKGSNVLLEEGTYLRFNLAFLGLQDSFHLSICKITEDSGLSWKVTVAKDPLLTERVEELPASRVLEFKNGEYGKVGLTNLHLKQHKTSFNLMDLLGTQARDRLSGTIQDLVVGNLYTAQNGIVFFSNYFPVQVITK